MRLQNKIMATRDTHFEKYITHLSLKVKTKPQTSQHLICPTFIYIIEL